jgi:hypothetical protein
VWRDAGQPQSGGILGSNSDARQPIDAFKTTLADKLERMERTRLSAALSTDLKRLCCSSEDMFFCAHERLAATQTSCEQFLGGGRELREEGEADEPGLLSPSLCHAVQTDKEWKIGDQWPKEERKITMRRLQRRQENCPKPLSP